MVCHCQLALSIGQPGQFLPWIFGRIQDPSNVCERSLGRMSKLKQQHLGPLEEDGITISMLLELYEDGPQSETGLAG